MTNEYQSEHCDFAWELDIGKVLGSPVVSLIGCASKPYGDALLQVTEIVLEDGRKLNLEGGHDIVFVESLELPQELIDELAENED